MNIVEQIEQFKPYNDQEKADKDVILSMIKNNSDIFERSNLIAHMTSSAWVVNQTHDKVLMIYHNIYHSWSWMGGHNDGEKDCLKVALKEVQEESGLKNLKVLDENIFSLETLTVDSHYKKGKYVPSHLHLNVSYLLEADEKEPIRIKEDENAGVAWFGLEEAINKSSEIWFRENIYRKLNEKLRIYDENN